MKLTLKQWRGAREISQKEMSERLDVHINTYQKWEEDPTKIKMITAQKIAKIFGVSLDDIDFSRGTTA